MVQSGVNPPVNQRSEADSETLLQQFEEEKKEKYVTTVMFFSPASVLRKANNSGQKQLVYRVKMVLSSLVAAGLVDLVSRRNSELTVSLKLLFVCVLDKRIIDTVGSWKNPSSNPPKKEEEKLYYLHKILNGNKQHKVYGGPMGRLMSLSRNRHQN